MKTYSLFIVIVTFVTFFSACKKDDESVKPKTKSDMISSISGKKWARTSMITKYTYQGQQYEEDATGAIYPKECTRDNIMVFFSNHNVEEREGANKCGNQEVIGSGTWDLRKKDTELSITIDGNTLTAKVMEITETSMKLEFPAQFTLMNGDKIEAPVFVDYIAH